MCFLISKWLNVYYFKGLFITSGLIALFLENVAYLSMLGIY